MSLKVAAGSKRALRVDDTVQNVEGAVEQHPESQSVICRNSLARVLEQHIQFKDGPLQATDFHTSSYHDRDHGTDFCRRFGDFF